MCSQEREEQRLQYLRTIFDTIPLPAFIVDSDVRIQDFNLAAEPFLGPNPELALYGRGGEVLHCVHSEAKGCGKSKPCKDCVIRNVVNKAMTGKSTCREIHQAELRTAKGVTSIDLLVTASLLPYTPAPRALLILENLTLMGELYRQGTLTRPRKSARKVINVTGL
jgi:PAS domain-containing protein